MANYTEINLDSFLPEDAMQRYRYIKDLQIQFPVTLYWYYHGNYLGTLNYIWKVPINPENQSETAQARVLATIQEKLPQYFTRQMRKNVLGKYSLVKNITPAILRISYYDLSGNAAVTSNDICKELEERLQLMLTMEDPSIICDLCQNNGFKGTKFDTFWDEIGAYFNENSPAVNDRRHGNVLYMPLAISIRDLREIITKRLNEKLIPETYVSFICADDKHKVSVGQGINTSTGVRNRKTIVFQETPLIACDHDFTKLSLTPSVIFFCNISQSIEDSFYSGKVFVSFKDTVFQPSSAIRHTTEFYNAIFTHHLNNIPPILCLYTDGSPDHRTIFGSVQISFICLFLHGNFDMLIVMCTAPHHSWTNPAERIMSILNLGLQGVALVRDTMSPESETAFAKLDTLDEIRAAAKTNETLQSDLCKCITHVQQILEGRTERLVLHDESFQCYDPADKTMIDEFFNIKKCGQLSCTICQSVWLSDDIFDSLDWLPNPIPSTMDKDHYANFQTAYRSGTTEQYRSTLMTTMANSERVPSSIFTNTQVREFIQCFQYGKIRCLYSERALSAEDKIACQISIDDWDYSCGSPFVPEDNILYNKIFCGHDNELVEPPESLKLKYKSLFPCCTLCRSAGKDIFARGEIKTHTRAAKKRKIGN
ncbi:hypothetical protein RirG_055230 [Rhizophagus irregularis DAOM 197198w]|uniref:Uncharacterized protein n=1 Tax=Rhizophagus irregularis (strain DAOM 197198w) TaxID=1432141 RepID=A0A015K2Y9_RHIIW|nr:hypothetical protein RirG_055230 [Rhizophagus irregularis DAOM 197198w]